MLQNHLRKNLALEMSTLYSHIERNRQATMYDEQQTVLIKKHVKYSHDQFMECIVYSGRPPGPGPRPDCGTNTTKIQCRNCFLQRKSGG